MLQTRSAHFSGCEAVDFHSYNRVEEGALGIEQVKNAIKLAVLASHFLD